MGTWKHPQYSTHLDLEKIHSKTVCWNCGWMYESHFYTGNFSVKTRCPEVPRMPGYPKEDKMNEPKKDLQQLEIDRQLRQIMKLENELVEQDFRINNLLDQASKSTGEACIQQKKIKELENQLSGSICDRMCHISRIRLEKEVERLKNLLIEQTASNHRNQDISKSWQIKHYQKEKEILKCGDRIKQLESIVEVLREHTRDAWIPWQPIETAPKDSFKILLRGDGWNGSDYGYVVVGLWDNSRNLHIDPVSRNILHNLTHWMPLPAEPK